MFTGDTLFVGAAGRIDLPGGSLAQLLASLEDKLRPLPDDTRVWPGHDYGEFPTSTLGQEKATNPYLTDFFLNPIRFTAPIASLQVFAPWRH